MNKNNIIEMDNYRVSDENKTVSFDVNINPDETQILDFEKFYQKKLSDSYNTYLYETMFQLGFGEKTERGIGVSPKHLVAYIELTKGDNQTLERFVQEFKVEMILNVDGIEHGFFDDIENEINEVTLQMVINNMSDRFR